MGSGGDPQNLSRAADPRFSEVSTTQGTQKSLWKLQEKEFLIYHQGLIKLSTRILVDSGHQTCCSPADKVNKPGASLL